MKIKPFIYGSWCWRCSSGHRRAKAAGMWRCRASSPARGEGAAYWHERRRDQGWMTLNDVSTAYKVPLRRSWRRSICRRIRRAQRSSSRWKAHLLAGEPANLVGDEARLRTLNRRSCRPNITRARWIHLARVCV